MNPNGNSKRSFYLDSVNGDDTRTGLSPKEAWRTLERANAQEYQPGDALRLKLARHAAS